MGLLRKYLIAGLLVWIPLAATVAIIKLMIDLLDGLILLLPPEYRPMALLGYSLPGFGLVLAITVLLVTGILAANLLGRRLVHVWEAILNRIPLVRSIYNSIKQITATILSSDSKAFRKVVMVEYPRKGCWSMGFLTNEQVQITAGQLTPGMCAVFIPTTPNPTSGYIVIVPGGEVTELEMTIEEGFKFIISLGVILPDRDIRESLPVKRVAHSGDGP